MKHFIVFCFFFLLCYNLAETQTNANIPGPENVLVVYKAPVDGNDSLGLVSQAIKDYYQNARNIPESNIVPLTLPRKPINVGDWSDPHIVKLGYDNEYIQKEYLI